MVVPGSTDSVISPNVPPTGDSAYVAAFTRGHASYSEMVAAKRRRVAEMMVSSGLIDAVAATRSSLKAHKVAEMKKSQTNLRQNPVKKSSIDDAGIVRRSTRKRKAVIYESNLEQETPLSDSEFEEDGHEDRDEEESSTVVEENISRATKKRSRSVAPKSEGFKGLMNPPAGPICTPGPSTFQSGGAPFTVGGLTCEFAKTGRSTCRRCSEKISKGAPRVGMTAWIVGRSAITWQCASCVYGNLVCGYDPTGRTKCKASEKKFVKGELRLGVKCHTAVSYYKCDDESSQNAALEVLGMVASWMPISESIIKLSIEDVEHSESLTPEDRSKLQNILATVESKLRESPTEEASPVLVGSLPEKKEASSPTITPERNRTEILTQPKLGAISGVKGKVEWKFGGHLCYGTLISRMETLTHCYARTKKGNVKTLAKGKNYWLIIK